MHHRNRHHSRPQVPSSKNGLAAAHTGTKSEPSSVCKVQAEPWRKAKHHPGRTRGEKGKSEGSAAPESACRKPSSRDRRDPLLGPGQTRNPRWPEAGSTTFARFPAPDTATHTKSLGSPPDPAPKGADSRTPEKPTCAGPPRKSGARNRSREEVGLCAVESF